MSFEKAKKNIRKKQNLIEKADELIKEIEQSDPEKAKKARSILDDMVKIACDGG